MNMKFVGDATTHPRLAEIFKDASEQNSIFNERVKFLRKQNDDIKADMDKKADEYRVKIRDVLIESGTLNTDVTANQLRLSKEDQVYIIPASSGDCLCFACAIERLQI